MLSKYVAPSVDTFMKYFMPFYTVTTRCGAIYGGNLGYKASLTAPTYKEKFSCITFGSIVGGLFGPAFVLSIPAMKWGEYLEFKVDYNSDTGCLGAVVGRQGIELSLEKRD
jgi:hypothetical protein